MKTKLKLVFRNMRYFIPLLVKTSPLTILCVIILALAESASSFSWIIFPKMIIEQLEKPGEKDLKKIITIVLVMVAVNFLISFSIKLFVALRDYLARKTDFVIDKMFNDKIMKVDYFNIEDPNFADRVARAKKGMNQLSGGIYSFIFALENIIYAIITISGVIGVILFSGEYLVILISIIGIVSNTIIYGKIKNVDKDFNDSIVRYNRKLFYYNKNMANFRMQKELRLYNSKELIFDISEKTNKEAYKMYRKHSHKLMRLDSLDSFVSLIFINFLSIIILGYSVYTKNMSIAVFTMLFSSLGVLDGAAANFTYSLRGYIQDCQYQEDFIDLMEMKSIFENGRVSLERIDKIEFKHVNFKYPRTENYVLRDLNFIIDTKQKISLVGLNGAGKTTIIKLLCRFYKVEEGEILINDVNIDEYEYNDLMKQIAIVFQDFKIISFSVKSNIAIIDENNEKLYDCLKRAQVLEKIESLPNKENTYINKWFDKTGVEFSGGEMQKFAIARCLYKDADFVILDEPTSALDPLAEAEIYYHFNDVIGHKLTLFISHRLSSCIFSDRILVLDGARICEEGTHKELMKNKNGLYYQMFTAQAEYYKD